MKKAMRNMPLKAGVQRLFQKKYIYHYLFWITHIIINLSFGWNMPQEKKGDWLSAQAFQIIAVMAMFYININILLPKYYRTKRYVVYIIVSLILMFFVQFAFDGYTRLFTSLMKNEAITWQYMMDAMVRLFRLYLISFFLGLADDWMNQQKRLSDMQVEKLKAELNYLRSQINPHFLFNTLNNLYSLALEKSEKTPDYILKLSNMMDYMLYESNEVKVPLEKDLKNLKNYIEIERIRQIDASKITYEVQGKIENQKIAPLLLLPLVENAFKHGLNRRISDNFVKVDIHIEGKILTCNVENNIGKEASEQDIEKNHGIGLQNLKRRLDLFYPQKHELNINEQDAFYRVSLKLDLS